jgi:hypothetical protein
MQRVVGNVSDLYCLVCPSIAVITSPLADAV